LYGKQWRDADGVDQLANAIEELKTNPTSRRIVVSAWNPKYLPISGIAPDKQAALGRMALAPCHYAYQFESDGEYLNLMWIQRSCDVGLGVPFDIASYALLLNMVAQITGLKANDLVFSGGDIHIYKNHIDKLKMQLERTPKKLPKLVLNKEIKNINDFTASDIELEGYVFDPYIKLDISV